MLNAVFYLLSTGCQWDALPKDLPPKTTVYDYFSLWRSDRTLLRLHQALYAQVREVSGRKASPTVAIVDSQSAKAAQKRMARPVGKWFVSAGLSSLQKRIRPFSSEPLAKMEIRASWSS